MALNLYEKALHSPLDQLLQLQHYTNVVEMYQAAERCELITKKGNFLAGPSKKSGNGGNGHQSTPVMPMEPAPPPLTTSQGGSAMDIGAMKMTQLKCHLCGKFGHIKAFCPKNTGLDLEGAHRATIAHFQSKKR